MTSGVPTGDNSDDSSSTEDCVSPSSASLGKRVQACGAKPVEAAALRDRDETAARFVEFVDLRPSATIDANTIHPMHQEIAPRFKQQQS